MWRCCNLGFHNDADDNGMEVVMRRTAMKINLTESLRLKHNTKPSGTADAGYLLSRDATICESDRAYAFFLKEDSDGNS